MPKPKKPVTIDFDPDDYEYDILTDRRRNGKADEELTMEELAFVKAVDDRHREEEAEQFFQPAIHSRKPPVHVKG